MKLIRLFSIIDERCIEEFSGYYYYKGYMICKDGNRRHPWTYGIIGVAEHSPVKTLKEAKRQIDSLLKGLTTDEIIQKVKKKLISYKLEFDDKI